jgi:regulator of protease activity HflC (stomatin/prohibitin superfamily)
MKIGMTVLIVAIVAILIGALTSCQRVPVGHVGIKVYLLGQKKGVDSVELGVGRYYIGINEDLYIFPTFQQNYVWTAGEDEGSPNDESFTFQTSEGMSVNTDLGIEYHISPTNITAIFSKYRKGVEELTDIVLRNAVRDGFNNTASKYPVEYVYGEGKTALLKEVLRQIQSRFTPQGIVVDNLYYIGSIRLPDNVVTALNNKVQAIQDADKAKNELEKTKWEAEKTVVKASAEAKANQVLSSSINASLIQWRRIELEEKAIDKWDGNLPATMIPGGSLPFVNLSK